MKSLIGTKVSHKVFGVGEIVDVDSAKGAEKIKVEFPETPGIKTFLFPSAFEKFLKAADEVAERKISSLIERLEEEALREKEAKLADEEKQKLREIARQEKELKQLLAKIDKGTVFAGKTKRVFIVHQGKTFYDEYSRGYLWAPNSGLFHHETMTEVRQGDIIINYANGGVVAVSEALVNCFPAPRPSELNGYGWDHMGWRVEARYALLQKPLDLTPYTDFIIEHRADKYSSFDSDANANQGYLYHLEDKIALLIKDEILRIPPAPAVESILNRIS